MSSKEILYKEKYLKYKKKYLGKTFEQNQNGGSKFNIGDFVSIIESNETGIIKQIKNGGFKICSKYFISENNFRNFNPDQIKIGSTVILDLDNVDIREEFEITEMNKPYYVIKLIDSREVDICEDNLELAPQQRLGDLLPRRLERSDSSPRRLGDSSPRRLGESSPRRLGESSPRRLERSDSSPRRLGDESLDERERKIRSLKERLLAKKQVKEDDEELEETLGNLSLRRLERSDESVEERERKRNALKERLLARKQFKEQPKIDLERDELDYEERMKLLQYIRDTPRPRFMDGDLFIELSTGKKGKVLSLDDDVYERMKRQSDPSIYRYNVIFNDGDKATIPQSYMAHIGRDGKLIVDMSGRIF